MKDNTQLHGVIVGRVDSNDYYKELIALIDQHQLQSQIQFIEESFDMPQLYAMADITLSTSRKAEAFGRVAVEGQAMQSLVIATDLGAAKETVLPDKTGFLVAPDDPQALANVIKHVISLDTSATHQLQQQARERVLSTFNKDIMLEKTLATYDNVLRR
ncbi:MAG: hypothetical protein COB66_06085 [Coxiella sp. (in: Bacteria)]|nr:MAG: hypothetical protein COB66_06085 [Coxiella sp. (in: g-proteobacteria)]